MVQLLLTGQRPDLCQSRVRIGAPVSLLQFVVKAPGRLSVHRLLDGVVGREPPVRVLLLPVKQEQIHHRRGHKDKGHAPG